MTDDGSPAAGAMQQLLVFVRAQDQWREQPLYLALLELIRARGGEGATVLHGVAGFSAGGRLIRSRQAGGAGVVPLTIVAIDSAERIAALIPEIDAMLAACGGSLAVTDVALYHTHHPTRSVTGPPERVGQIMQTHVVSVPPDLPVADLLPMLLNKPYKALPVVDAEGHVLGMVTDGDLLRAQGLGLPRSVLEAIQDQGAAGFAEVLQAVRASGKTARDIMGVRPAALIGPQDSIDDAARRMVQHGVKRLPVVDHEGRLIGILARLDVLRAASSLPGGRPVAPALLPPATGRTVGEVMVTDVPAVLPDAPLTDVIDAVVGSAGERRVVVISDPQERRVLGIITESDLVRRGTLPGQVTIMRMLMEGFQLVGSGLGAPPLAPAGGPSAPARLVMTEPVVTARAGLPLTGAIALMVERRLSALPVVDDSGRLLGIVDRRRILQALTGVQAGPAA